MATSSRDGTQYMIREEHPTLDFDAENTEIRNEARKDFLQGAAFSIRLAPIQKHCSMKSGPLFPSSLLAKLSEKRYYDYVFALILSITGAFAIFNNSVLAEKIVVRCEGKHYQAIQHSTRSLMFCIVLTCFVLLMCAGKIHSVLFWNCAATFEVIMIGKAAFFGTFAFHYNNLVLLSCDSSLDIMHMMIVSLQCMMVVLTYIFAACGESWLVSKKMRLGTLVFILLAAMIQYRDVRFVPTEFWIEVDVPFWTARARLQTIACNSYATLSLFICKLLWSFFQGHRFTVIRPDLEIVGIAKAARPSHDEEFMPNSSMQFSHYLQHTREKLRFFTDNFQDFLGKLSIAGRAPHLVPVPLDYPRPICAKQPDADNGFETIFRPALPHPLKCVVY